MRKDEYIPICADCKHVDEYIPHWLFPSGNPKCHIFHISVNPERIACSKFEGWGQRYMKKLVKFNQEYYEPIKKGAKTQTMRMPQKRLDVEQGEKVIAIFPNGEELLLKIIDVGYKAFKSINDDDAKREGFNTAEELKKVLCDIYKDYSIMDSSRFYFYRFEYLEVNR